MKYLGQVCLGLSLSLAIDCAAEPGNAKSPSTEGARLRLSIERFAGKPDPKGARKSLEVFTSQPQLLAGASFVLLAPEHRMLQEVTAPVLWSKVKSYAEESRTKSFAERTNPLRKASGLFLGSYVVNPLSGWRIPLWVSDGISGDYPGQACLGIPAHEPWQFAFAREHGIDVVPVLRLKSESSAPKGETLRKAYSGAGTLVDSGALTGIDVSEAKGSRNPAFTAAVTWLKEHGRGEPAEGTSYRAWALARRKAITQFELAEGKQFIIEKKLTTEPSHALENAPTIPSTSESTQPSSSPAGEKRDVFHACLGGFHLPSPGTYPTLNKMVDHCWLFSKPRRGMREITVNCPPLATTQLGLFKAF